MKKLVAVCSFVLVILGLGYYYFLYSKDEYSDTDYPEIQEKGVVRIVTNFDPIGYFVSSDSISGYNHDMLVALEKYANLKFDISVENSLENSFAGLKSGKYDIIARNIPVNSDLRSEYSFTEPTVFNKLVLVQRKAKYNNDVQPIRNHLELANQTIHVSKNSPSIFRLQNLSAEIGDSIFIIEDDLYEANQLVLMVASGDIKLTVCDSKTAEKLADDLAEIDIDTDVGFTHLEAWAVRANSTQLLDSLNAWIGRFKETKEYRKIERKYD